jgi:protein ImuB
MFWIALLPSHEEERQAWGWRALQFTPRVAQLDEALVLEVSACERLWGGRKRLLRRLLAPQEALSKSAWAAGPSSLIALALLRLQRRGEPAPTQVPDGLPLDVLTAAQDHLMLLERVGCRTWGQLRALPRAGVARRFGAPLVQALDCAYGEQPESYDWLELPEHFDVKLELPALACSAPELMWTGQRLLGQLQLWLQARNRGVLSLELEWTLDLKRLNGKPLPPTERLEVRTAQATQDMAHLRKLVGEHLARTSLGAPANHLRMRSLQTVPWGGATTSLLPEERREGERLHQLVERLSVRLGEHNVLVAEPHEDHRPERRQRWVPARHAPLPHLHPEKNASIFLGGSGGPLPKGAREQKLPLPAGEGGDALYPTWVLPRPLPLEVQGTVPQYGGPLRRLARLYRVETAWWEEGGPALRDYFIARSDEVGLVWIYRERLPESKQARWYLQGLYA